MAMTKNTKTMLGVGGGLLGLLLIAGAMRTKKHKTVVRPGDTTERFMGEQFLLRLPRGEYEMQGGDGLVMVSDRDAGNSTDIVIAVEERAVGYVVQPFFTDVDNPAKRYKVTVVVKEWPEG